MTIHDALSAAQAMFPKDAKYLKLEVEFSVGYRHGTMKEFYIWNYAPGYASPLHGNSIVATSYRSWEHALAIAKSSDEDCWPEQDVDAEVLA